MALSALLKVDGKHERLRRLFISKLLRPGIVAVHKPPGAQEASAWWVLGSFEFGAIGVPVSLKKKRGLKVAIPDWSRDPPWEHLLADDWTYWNGFAIRAVPPTEACLDYGLDGTTGREYQGVIMAVPGELDLLPVTSLCAQVGFSGFTVEVCRIEAKHSAS